MFELKPLNYKYNELEPFIDAKTIEVHYSKHHQNYCNNLNKALEDYPNLQTKSITELLSDPNAIPQAIRQAVINNGGGYYNHTLYLENMSARPNKAPNSDTLKQLELAFGSLENFKTRFNDTAMEIFGSGWLWLVKNHRGELSILATSNQDSPLSLGLRPVLTLDVWEHAYYLKYQNRRADYITAWWNVVTWN